MNTIKKYFLSILFYILISTCFINSIYAFNNSDLLNEKNYPIVYSGKINTDYKIMNTQSIQLNNLVDNELLFEFNDEIKIVSYEIVEVNGISGIDKGTYIASSDVLNKSANILSLKNISINDTNNSITIKFNVVSSPTYIGEIKVKVVDREFIIAKVMPAVEIITQSTNSTIDLRKIETSDIVIKENYSGALSKNSELIIGCYNMKFSNDFNYETKGGIQASLSNNNGNLIIKILEESKNDKGVITISNLSFANEKEYNNGTYPLYVISGSEAYIDNNGIVKGNSPLFETYTKNIIDYLPLFNENRLVVKKDYLNVKASYINNDIIITEDNISFKIGSDIININNDIKQIDSPAYISNSGYTMLPVRSIVDALSYNTADINWDSNENKVTISYTYKKFDNITDPNILYIDLYETKIIEIIVGSDTMYINGKKYNMVTPSEITKNRIFIPIRDLCYAFEIEDDNIIWNEQEQSITILKENYKTINYDAVNNIAKEFLNSQLNQMFIEENTGRYVQNSNNYTGIEDYFKKYINENFDVENYNIKEIPNNTDDFNISILYFKSNSKDFNVDYEIVCVDSIIKVINFIDN